MCTEQLVNDARLCAESLVVSRTVCGDEDVEKCTLSCFKEKKEHSFLSYFIRIQRVIAYVLFEHKVPEVYNC